MITLGSHGLWDWLQVNHLGFPRNLCPSKVELLDLQAFLGECMP